MPIAKTDNQMVVLRQNGRGQLSHKASKVIINFLRKGKEEVDENKKIKSRL